MRQIVALAVALLSTVSIAATLVENAAAVTNLAAQIDAAIRAKGGTTTGGLAAAPAAILAIPTGGGIGPWFRWTYEAKYPSEGSLDVNFLALSRLALFNASDECVNLNMIRGSSAAALAAGQFWQDAGDGNAGNVFAPALSTKWTHDSASLPQCWTMRLADDAGAVKYSIAVADVQVLVSGGIEGLRGRYPSAWILETSADGTAWREIDRRSGVTPPATANSWYAGGGTGTTPTTFYGF